MARILLVDDDLRIQESYKILLRYWGHEALAASDINTARHALKTEPLDLVIIDLRLEDDTDSTDFSGLSLAKETYQKIPTLIISAYPDPEALKELLSLGRENIAFVSKAASPEHIKATIESLLKDADSYVTFSLLEEGQILNQRLTPMYLKSILTPYLDAVSELQLVLDRILSREPRKTWVRVISQNSPISVSLQGALEATDVIRELVTPWRREHAEKMALLEEQEKVAQIEIYRVEVHEKRMQAQRERIGLLKAELEVEKSRAEIARINLENEKLKVEIQEKRIELASKVVESLAPFLPESQRITFIIQVLEPLEVITNSPLKIADTKE